MFNADGSEAEMCGNGIRCVAKYVYDHGISQRRQLKIETGAGVLALDLEVDGGTRAPRASRHGASRSSSPRRFPCSCQASSNRVALSNLPLEPHVRIDDRDGWIEACGLDPRMTCVSMGNPHVVLYCRDVAAVPLAMVGPLLETQPDLPTADQRPLCPGPRTARGDDAHLGARQRHHAGLRHRGLGRVRGRQRWPATAIGKILAHLPGGDLELEWADDDHVYMTGPAAEVFSGEWPS